MCHRSKWSTMPLVAFDFDGTLSESEMTVLLGERAGVGDRMAEITRRAMNDELSYAESLRERAGLLEGMPMVAAAAAFLKVELRDGTGSLLADLQEAGVTTAILTGGFQPGVEGALDSAGTSVDVIVANELPTTEDNELAGTVEGPLVEGSKDDALADICAKQGFALEDTVVVGDGANDLPMLEVAGLAIGFDPKPAVEPACDVVVEDVPALRSVLEAEGLLPA